jgi:hypothetical protein
MLWQSSGANAPRERSYLSAPAQRGRGTAEGGGGGVLTRRSNLRLRMCVAAAAPSTALRAVPLPRFAGAEEERATVTRYFPNLCQFICVRAFAPPVKKRRRADDVNQSPLPATAATAATAVSARRPIA